MLLGWALVPSSQSTLEPVHGNQLREEGWSKLNVGAIIVTCHTAHVAMVRCEEGNQVPVLYRETRKPHSRCTKVQTQIFILARNQARRHRVYSGNHPEHSSLPRTHETQKPSVSQGLKVEECNGGKESVHITCVIAVENMLAGLCNQHAAGTERVLCCPGQELAFSWGNAPHLLVCPNLEDPRNSRQGVVYHLPINEDNLHIGKQSSPSKFLLH